MCSVKADECCCTGVSGVVGCGLAAVGAAARAGRGAAARAAGAAAARARHTRAAQGTQPSSLLSIQLVQTTLHV